MKPRIRLAILLHGWALRLHPQLALIIHHTIRQATIDELAAQHREHVAQRAARQ